MVKSNFILNSTDRKGHDLKIECTGIDDRELTHFGGLDLHVKATKEMIASSTNGMSFPEKEGDYDIGAKVVALYLNEIGQLLRNTYNNDAALEEYSNIDLIKSFIEDELSKKTITDLIEKDNQLIKDEIEREKAIDDEIWDTYFKNND